MNNKALNPLVDADYIVYGVGFAVKDDEPLEYALATVRTVVHELQDTFPERTAFQLYLSGKGNFRNALGTIQVYKGNRDPAMRPEYYDEIREYMIDHHGAIVVDGMEAEDAVGIEQWKHKDKSTVIIGVDKDLDMIPGYRYHPKKKTLGYITKQDADYNFCMQWLTGDRVDNIPGIKGVGPVNAAKLLAPCNKEWIKMHEVVAKEYNRQYQEQGPAAMRENGMLLWILREEGITYDRSSIKT